MSLDTALAVWLQVLNIPGPKLYIVNNGQGSPCLDLRRVPDILAEACAGTDLLIIEGMGRWASIVQKCVLLSIACSIPSVLGYTHRVGG